MQVDKLDEELESKLLCELDFIAEQLRGKITKSVYANSRKGRDNRMQLRLNMMYEINEYTI